MASQRQITVVLGLVSFAVFAFTGVRYVGRLQASGDEPHYLLMAQSLWQEHDLDLRDNVERRDYEAYVPGSLTPHYGWPRRDGRPFPAHSPGLPVLIAPAWAAWGRPGVVLLLSALAAALVVESRRWVHLLGGSDRAGLWAAGLLALSPVLFYSFHVYTEVPSALAAWAALRLVWERRDAWRTALAALLVSSLPWLHTKMVPAAVVIGVVALVRLRGRSRLLFIAVTMVMALLFGAYIHHVYGHLTGLLGIYAGAPTPVHWMGPVRAAVGLILDRSYGLLPVAPTLLVALAPGGWASLLRSGAGRAAAGLTAAIVIPALWWRQWWGGMSPPARLLVPALMLFACIAGLRRDPRPRGLARLLVPLAAVQAGLVVYAVWRPEARLLLNRTDRPSRLWEALGGAFPLGDYLPAVAGVSGWTAPALAWLAILVAVLVADAIICRTPSRSEPSD